MIRKTLYRKKLLKGLNASYDGLVDIRYEKHYRVHLGANEFAR